MALWERKKRGTKDNPPIMGLHFLWVSVGIIFEKKLGNTETSSLLACSARSISGDLDTVLLRASVWHEDKLWGTLQTLAPQAPVMPLHRGPRVETESKKRQSSFLIFVPKISRCSLMIGKKKEKRK